jgi:hypothetical protein
VLLFAQPHLIAGRHPRFDPLIFEKYQHGRLTRLWVPLLSIKSLRDYDASATAESIVESLSWRDDEEVQDADEEKSCSRVADWRCGSLSAKDLASHTFGTLEIGFE